MERRWYVPVLTPALAALALSSGGCSGERTPSDAATWTESDSAGVVVVENRLEGLPSALWAVDSSPELSIGGLDARESHQLYQIAGATRLPDGRLAVASAGTFDIRVYGTDGALVARYGMEGDGPGEFRSPALVGRYGPDTLVVFDATLSRISLIHAGEGPVGSTQVQWSGRGFPVARGLLADGSLLVGGGMAFSSEEGFPTGVIRPLSTYGLLGRDGGERTRLGDFVAAEMFARANEQGFMARGLPFAGVTLATPGAGGVWLTTMPEWTLDLLGPDGAVIRSVRTDGARRSVAQIHRADYAEEAVAETSTANEARQIRDILAEMPFPDAFPPYQALLTDALGNLWAQDYLAPEEETPHWTVFDPLGRALLRITTPPRTRVLEIGEDYLLGRTLDELGVESMTLWRLRRG